MSILAGIVALLKAIPAIRDIFEKMVGLSLEYDRKKSEVEASRRKAEKDALVDAALAQFDKLQPRPAGQQPTVDGAPGLVGGSNRGPGVGS